MEASHFIPIQELVNVDSKIRDQNSLLNQSSAKILLIDDSVISYLGRYPEIWKKYFSSHTL